MDAKSANSNSKRSTILFSCEYAQRKGKLPIEIGSWTTNRLTKFNADFKYNNNYLQVNILVAGGCRFWCHKQDGKITPSLKSAEMYNVELDTWFKAADLPVPLQSASMELLGGKPTIIGGFDSDSLDWNPNL